MNLIDNILLLIFIFGGLFLIAKLSEACNALRNWWKNRNITFATCFWQGFHIA